MAGTPRIPRVNPTHAHTHQRLKTGRQTLLGTNKHGTSAPRATSGSGTHTTRRSPLSLNAMMSLRSDLSQHMPSAAQSEHSLPSKALGLETGGPKTYAEAVCSPLTHGVWGRGKFTPRKAVVLQPPPQPIDANALRDAIAADNPSQLAQVIREFRLHQMPLVLSDGTPALIHALKIDAGDATIGALLDEGCETRVLSKRGHTPLILACAFGRIKVVDILLAYADRYDINYESADGSMALLRAVRGGHTEICDRLIRAGANVRAVNKFYDSPLSVAYYMRWAGIEQLLVMSGALEFPIPSTCASIRDYRRAAKHAVVALGPVAPLPQATGPFAAPDLVTSQMFVSDERDRVWLNGVMHMLYACQELRVLIDLMALVACGKHGAGVAAEADGKYKKLKIFCVPNIDMLYPVGNNGFGLCTNKTSVFVMTHGRERCFLVVGTMVHELMHLAMRHVFQNRSRPYPEGDHDAAAAFDAIIAVTRTRLTGVVPLAGDGDGAAAHRCLMAVFDDYPQEEHASELIVRCPQIMAMLGAQKGLDYLRANVPELLAYYLDVVTPAMVAYLAAHHGEQFILPVDQKATAAAMVHAAEDRAHREALYRQKCDDDAAAPWDVEDSCHVLQELEAEHPGPGLESDPRYVAAKALHVQAVRRVEIAKGQRWPDALGHLNP